MPDLFSATLNPSGPNYETWMNILGTSVVPLHSPRSVPAALGEEKDVEIYVLNLKAMTLIQRARLVRWVVQKFGVLSPEVEAEMDRWDFPIRAEDVVVTFSTRAL